MTFAVDWALSNNYLSIYLFLYLGIQIIVSLIFHGNKTLQIITDHSSSLYKSNQSSAPLPPPHPPRFPLFYCSQDRRHNTREKRQVPKKNQTEVHFGGGGGGGGSGTPGPPPPPRSAPPTHTHTHRSDPVFCVTAVYRAYEKHWYFPRN